MTSATVEKSVELDIVRMGIELLSKSTNANDMCRRLSHAEFMDGNCFGVAVFLLDQRSMLVEVASYGRGYSVELNDVSAWDDTVISKAVRSRKVVIEQGEESKHCVLPTQHDDVVTGVMVFNLAKHAIVPEFSDNTFSMLSSLGGLFMHSQGLSLQKGGPTTSRNTDDGVVSVEELTTRQIQIVKLIADGLTNAEIAKNVLLSESTVRQETIRIFRILKCHNRTEAIVKARANGILESTPPPAMIGSL